MAEKLYLACKDGQVSVAQGLLSKGTRGSLNETVYDASLGYSCTPLHAAVIEGHCDIVELLLTNGADPIVLDEEKSSPLYSACKKDRVKEALILIQYGARAHDDKTENYTKSAWHSAVMNDLDEVVGAMLDQNARLLEAAGPTKWNGLHYACQNGKRKVAKLLIDRNCPINTTINTGRTPLHLAAFQGHAVIVENLLNAKADPNIKSSHGDGGWTPLILAAQEGNADCVRHILAASNINVQLRAKNGRNALHSCSFHGHVVIAKMLIDSGIEAGVSDENSWTQLHLCCQENHFEIVEYILTKAKNINPSAQAKNGRTPLHSAALKGNAKAVEMLLRHKDVKIEQTDSRKWTPLHVACQNGRTECARILIDARANVNCQIDSGRNTLHLVAFEGYPEIARMLLDTGVDYKHTDNQQWTPLHLATQEGKTDVAMMILERDDAPINFRAHNGRTSLHSAAFNGRVEITRVLLKKKADLMMLDKDGWTALHLASQQGHDDIVRQLTAAGSVVNKQSNNERTPLHLAAMKGHKAIVVYLLNQGADAAVKDCKKWIPLHVAANHSYDEIVQILLDRGSPVDALIDMGRTALHLAAFNGHSQVVSVLLDRGASMDIADKDKWTCLHLACQEGKTGAVRTLLQKGADVHKISNNGRTPLHSAVTSGQGAIVQELIDKGAQLDASMNDGQTPLHTAVLYKKAEAVTVLLENNAPVNKTKNSGDTALHIAASDGLTEICEMLLGKGIDRKIENKAGKTALNIANTKGHLGIVNLIQNFVVIQPTAPPLPVVKPSAPPAPATANKRQTLFVAFGPNEVQSGEEVTLRIYCIDTSDSTAKEDVYHFEKQGDRVAWGAPCRCNLPMGQQVDLNVERTSRHFVIGADSMLQTLEEEWVGFTSADFEIDVENPEAVSREEVLIRISTQGTKLTDLKVQYRVRPGSSSEDSKPPPYPEAGAVSTADENDPPPKYGDDKPPPAVNLDMIAQNFIFVSYSSAEKDIVLPIVYHLLEQGIPVWLDQQQILAGEMWDEQLGTALRKCKGVLCCLSDNWFSSVPCKTELRAVRRRIELRDNIPANSIWPVVVNSWNGYIPDDCYYNLSGDSTQRLDFTVGPVNSDKWTSTCKVLTQRLKKFLEAL